MPLWIKSFLVQRFSFWIVIPIIADVPYSCDVAGSTKLDQYINASYIDVSMIILFMI